MQALHPPFPPLSVTVRAFILIALLIQHTLFPPLSTRVELCATHATMVAFPNHCFQGYSQAMITGLTPTAGRVQKVLRISRVGSGRVGSGRVGSGGFQTLHLYSRVAHTRPDPTRPVRFDLTPDNPWLLFCINKKVRSDSRPTSCRIMSFSWFRSNCSLSKPNSKPDATSGSGMSRTFPLDANTPPKSLKHARKGGPQNVVNGSQI